MFQGIYNVDKSLEENLICLTVVVFLLPFPYNVDMTSLPYQLIFKKGGC